jgi:hypothetical protein
MSGQRIAINADSFGQFRVKEMSESDWFLGSATSIAIKSQKPHIILFYEPSSVDPDLIDIFNDLARTIAGAVIASVNTSARGEIMDAFLSTSMDLDNPLYDFSGFGVPTILVYRNRWPQAFYNGEWSYNAIKKWITTLACKVGYRERTSLWHGVRAVEGGDAIVGDPRIQNYPYPTSSKDYTSSTGEVVQEEGEPQEAEAASTEEGDQDVAASDEEEAPASDEEEPVPDDENADDVGYLNE